MDFNSWTLSSFGNQTSKKSDVLSPVHSATKLPRIILRNAMGFELKTETSYQNAIYRAKTKLLEPNRRLTEMEWRLPHAPVPSRPDYTRSLEYDDFRLMKKPPKPLDPHKIEHWDMSFWDYLLPDRQIDRATVNVRTMEKYCRSTDAVPNPEFMNNFDSLKSIKQLFLTIVSSSSTLDKVVAGFGDMDNRKKMIMTQVLSSLLRGDFASLEDLPANVRNGALLDLAKLASEGKLSAEMQEKVFTELAQNLTSLPPDMRAKVTEQLIKSIENVPPEIREQVLQQILGTIDALSEDDRQKVLHDLVKKISSMPEESRNALLEKIMNNMDNLAPDAKIQLLQDLLRDADTIPSAMRDNILQNLINSLDTLPPGERERVLAELTKNLANLPPNIRQQLLEKLLEKTEELPPELRDQMYAEILKNVPGMPEELKRKLVVELLKNVDNMDPSLRQNVMKEILNNLDLIDDTMHGQVLQNFLQSLNDVPPNERDELLKKIIEKSSNLDDPEMKRQLLEEILKNPSNLSPSAFQELVKNVGELPPDLQERLYAELLQKKDDLPPSVLEEIIRNSANVPQAVLTELLKSVDKLAPSSLAELAKHLNVLPDEVRTKLLADVMNSMDNLDSEQKAALIGELLKNQTNLTPKQLETLMKNLDELDPTLKEQVLKGLVDNMDTLPPSVKDKLIQDLLNKDSDMDQETRVKLLSKLLENPDDLTEEEKGKIFTQLMHEIDNVKDPEIKKKLLNDMLTNFKDLPSETMTQLISNINDLPPSEQKELLKQILEKFDELPPEMKEKLVDDLLKSAASMPVEVQKQMITDLLNEMKDLSAEERSKLIEKVLDNPNLDPSVRAQLMEEMFKNVDNLPPEERKKLLEKMLENSEDLNPAVRTKLMDEMIKNMNHMSSEEREKFLTDLVNDPTKKDLLKELLNNGQISNEMKKKIVDEIAKKPMDPSTLLNVLQNSKEIPPELLEKVLKTVENMSAKELNELAKKLDTLPPGMKQRVMKEMMKNIQDLDSKTQANILREMLRNSVDMDPKVISDLIRNITNLTPVAIKELLTKADKLPPEALKELLKHIDEIPVSVLEDLVKNADQLSPDVIAALLASKDLPPAIRDKLIKEINSNKKLRDKLKTLDPLAKGVEGVGKIIPKPKPEVKKPKIDIPPVSKKISAKLADLYGRLFGKEGALHLDSDLEVLANIDESELEALLHDPDFLNLDPNLPPEVRRQLIEEIRKKRLKQRIVDVPPLSKDKLQEIDDPLDYLYKYCIIHPDRMANYERIFLNTIKKQKAKFEGQNPPETTTKLINLKRNNTDTGVWTNVGGGKYIKDSKQYHALDSSDEDEDIDKPNITKHRDGPNMVNFEKEIRDGAFDSELPPMRTEIAQKIDKINFITNDLRKKEAEVTQTLNSTNERLNRMTAEAIMDLYPEVLDPEYDSKKKKQRTSDKTISELKSYGSLYTTEQLLTRLSKSQIQIVDGQTEIKQLNGQISWSKNKLVQLRMRIEMLIGERESLIARDQEERQQAMYKYQRVEKFRRQQSPLWNALHPTIDYEMNIEELDKALRQINGNLISDKECQYIRFILKIPGVKRVNLKVFSLIAALSEKVNQIEPFVRKLINKFDYEALDIKMLKAKELFYLMADKSQKLAPKGYVPLRALCIELAAGGVERENIEYCKKKFDREGKNYVDFMDWLIYVPLFVEIHNRIVSNPFLRYEDPLKPSKESPK